MPPKSKDYIPNITYECWVDGSFNKSNNTFSMGVVIIPEEGNEIRISQRFKNEDSEFWNIAGELYASIHAIQYCLDKKASECIIYHDLQGIAGWGTGTWKCNNDLTRRYSSICKKANQTMSLKFIKVKGHSGEYYNDVADRLAGSATFAKKIEEVKV